MNPPTGLPPGVRDQLLGESVLWLTTTTAAGAPSPTPVWFVLRDDEFVVFSDPAARKVANIARQPLVTLHRNCDAEGRGIVVITGTAEVTTPAPASAEPGYLDKYGERMARRGTSVEQFDRLSCARIVVRPHRVWQGPGTLARESARRDQERDAHR